MNSNVIVKQFVGFFKLSGVVIILSVFYTLILFQSCSSYSEFKTVEGSGFDGFPDRHWYAYEDIEAAGWDPVRLDSARMFYDSLYSSAVFLVHKGGVVLSWGEVDRKFWTHSMRKSLLFSMIGIYEGEGAIDLNKTMAQLGIDDKQALSDEEKQATVRHLLKCRSGIYHPAGNEAPVMKDSRPERGSHPPDSFYYYNNWDFNTLLTIYEQETQTKFFREFKRKIADPIQMEHFRVKDGIYDYDTTQSIHPGYPMMMSAMDLARYGLLYLNKGSWKGEQIIPSDWIRMETTPYSIGSWGYGVGFKWAIPGYMSLKPLKTYYNSGYRGHRLFIIPELDIVFVHRVDTFQEDHAVGQRDVEKLLKLILLANPGIMTEGVYKRMLGEVSN